MDNTTRNNKEQKYIVIRNGYRVSENVYDSPDHPEAISELEFWKRVASRTPHVKEDIRIVVYDEKKYK